jgi:hypothetical protein
MIWSVESGGTIDQQRGSPTIDNFLPKKKILGHPAQITVHRSSNKAFDVAAPRSIHCRRHALAQVIRTFEFEVGPRHRAET